MSYPLSIVKIIHELPIINSKDYPLSMGERERQQQMIIKFKLIHTSRKVKLFSMSNMRKVFHYKVTTIYFN